MRRNILSWCVALTLFAGGMVQANGRVLSPQALPEPVRAQLEVELSREKAANPEAFTQLARVVAQVETLDARKRGRLAPLSPLLKALGPDALWPMVERIAFVAGEAPGAASAHLALDVGLIEAAGYLRDPRVAPIWIALLDGAEQRPEVVRAAAGALARLDTDAAAAKLVALAQGDGLRRDAALAMMGNCRRLVVARALADAALKHPGDVRAMQTIIRSLGDVGNAWAWRTPSVAARSEEGAVRQVAAQALLTVWLEHDGAVRQAAANALLVVDAPTTPLLLQRARAQASADDRQALDALAVRLANNPAR